MVFQGFNEQLFQEKVIKRYAADKKRSMMFGIALALIILILASSFLYVQFNNAESSSDMFAFISGIPKYISLLIFPTIAFWGLSNGSLRHNKKMMYLYHHPDKYIFYPDFHMEIHSENKDVIIVQSITSITLNKDNKNKVAESFLIKGRITKNGKTVSSLILSAYLKDIQVIIQLLSYHKEQSDHANFKNTTMKQILQLQEANRNQYFVEELLQSQFLLPVRLVDDNAQANIVEIFENVWAEYATDENQHVCVYTSKEEIGDEIDTAFGSYKIVSLPELCAILEGIKSFVFQEREQCLIINSNSDHVILNKAQVMKINRMGELDYGNYWD